MDKAWKAHLAREAAGAGIPLSEEQLDRLAAHAELLLRWNAKVNLTRITDPDALRVKHVLDSLLGLAVVPESARTVLDLGSGGGFPGIPWLIARPALAVTMVESAGKKAAFLKTAVAQLKLANGRALHARAEGSPEAERIGRAQVVVSRAFTALAEMLRVGAPYLAPGGAIVAMLGSREGQGEIERAVADGGFELAQQAAFELPGGLGSRRVLRIVPRGTSPG